MTIASDLTRIKGAKTAIRQAIIDKGVDVPETDKLDTYYSYIDQITGKPTGPTGDGTLADLKLALSTDNPAEYYPIGTEIPDTYAGNNNPLIVAQYLDSTNNSAYGGAEGVILVRKYVEPVSQVFGMNVDYATSTVKNLLDTTYLNNCSDELKSAISNISIPYYNGSAMNSILSKWFLMSAYEVCGKGNKEYDASWEYEGIMWKYWLDKTGLSEPSNFFTANEGRIVRNRNGAAQTVWLRSMRALSDLCIIMTSGSVQFGASNAGYDKSNGVLPACFISKD